MEDAKAQRQLTLRSPRYAGYEVGYSKPPSQHQFKKGKSGNPRGRPKGGRNKLPALHEERLKTIVLEEAYRQITVREGEKNISVPMATAVVRSLAVSAAKGNSRAAQLFTQMVKVVEDQHRELHFSYFRSVLDYKDAWYKELARREKLGIKLPDPLPHPDDLIVDARTGTVTTRGPLIEREKDWWLTADIIKEGFTEKLAAKQSELKRNPDHPDRDILLRDIAQIEDDLARLTETFTDEVMERVVKSRTNAEGEVEFVDPAAVLKFVGNVKKGR